MHIAAWILATACLWLAGCRKPPPPPPPPPASTQGADTIVVGYAAPEFSGGQTVIMRGFLREAQARRWQVLVTNANSGSDTQAAQIDFLISQKVRAIVAVPVDSEKIGLSIRKARQAGIAFYTIDRAPVGEKVNMVVLSDNFLAGVQAGEAMVRLLTERFGRPKGVVLELQGDLKTNVARLRGEGFHSVLDRHPDIEIISRPTFWQPAQFANQTQVLLARTRPDGIFLHSDAIGVPSVLPVLRQQGMLVKRGQPGHIIITGVDGSPQTLEAIAEGYVDQASSQPLPDFGLIARWIEKEFRNEPIVAEVVTEPQALWSPATVRAGPNGWELILPTTSVTVENLDTPGLWGKSPP